MTEQSKINGLFIEIGVLLKEHGIKNFKREVRISSDHVIQFNYNSDPFVDYVIENILKQPNK